MKDRHTHQMHQGGKDGFAFQLRRGEHALQRSVAFCSPLRAEAVGHFAMNHAGAQSAFAHVVGRRHARIMQEGQQFVAVFGEARLQAERPLPRDLLRQQVIQLRVQAFRLGDELGQGERRLRPIKLMQQVNGGLEQLLHGLRPSVLGVGVQHPLQVAQLMRQAQLKDPCGRFELRAETITDPNLHRGVAHQVGQHCCATTRGQMMINPGAAAHHPLPPGPPLDARTGFVTVDDSAGLNGLLDGRRHVRRRRPGARQNGIHAAFAECHARQVVPRPPVDSSDAAPV